MLDHHDLRVWKKSHGLVLSIYRATAAFPPEERFGLTAQLRRSAVSIASNIAEGTGRETSGEMRRFVSFAAGSASEVECQIEIARDLGLLEPAMAEGLLTEIGDVRRMLAGLLRSTRRQPDMRPPT